MDPGTSEDTGIGLKFSSEEMIIMGSSTLSKLTADFNYSFSSDLVPHHRVQFKY